jgi:hypothetical protein
MGAIGRSISGSFPVDDWRKVVADFNRAHGRPGAPFPVLSIEPWKQHWTVLTGDQELFLADSEDECRDFALGVIVGAKMFST